MLADCSGSKVVRRRRRGRPSSVIITEDLQPSEQQFPCPNCPSRFSYDRGLQQHLTYACFQKPRFKCPYCEYKSKYRYNAYNHIRNTHKGSEVFCIDVEDDDQGC